MKEYDVLNNEEKVNLRLRALYEDSGLTKYRMNKFEEYSFYLSYKNFLESDRFITFTDIDGRLMALKPDITLSIAKNAPEKERRLYYCESIFRAVGGEFKEIRQTGVELMGPKEALSEDFLLDLALRSLDEIGDSVLSISHMGYISGVIGQRKSELLPCIKSKSLHGLKNLDADQRVLDMCALSGRLTDCAPEAARIAAGTGAEGAAEELCNLARNLNAKYRDRVRLDFSDISDTDYYNGLLLSGFTEGIAQRVLVGGRYDNLLMRMGKSIGAMGFALNFSALERKLNREVSTDA